MLFKVFLGLLLFSFSSALCSDKRPGSQKILEVIPIDTVWSGHPVGFCLYTSGDRQYVAYYDAKRRMKVASRKTTEKTWKYKVLPSRLGWDSHNGVVLAVDSEGCVHLAGNMHCSPLTYFRTEKPHDIESFKRVQAMVPGRPESSVTYPRFFRDPKGRLIFGYRDGGSGNGRRFFNVYDPKTHLWKPLFEPPLLDGLGKANAYPVGPSSGPDGWFHLVWMWRDTPDCRTNHHLCYARSPDLVHYFAASGKALSLPITLQNKEVVVDPAGPYRGLINMGFGVGFDHRGRPIIHYHKYDSEGNSQIYDARWEGESWRIYQVSSWKVRWEFGGGGSVPCLIRAGPVRPASKKGLLCQSFWHFKHGSGTWILREKDLRCIKESKGKGPFLSLPPELSKPKVHFPGMRVRWASDSGNLPKRGLIYKLRWETLGPNRDRPRKGKLPPPSSLVLVVFSGQAEK